MRMSRGSGPKLLRGTRQTRCTISLRRAMIEPTTCQMSTMSIKRHLTITRDRKHSAHVISPVDLNPKPLRNLSSISDSIPPALDTALPPTTRVTKIRNPLDCACLYTDNGTAVAMRRSVWSHVAARFSVNHGHFSSNARTPRSSKSAFVTQLSSNAPKLARMLPPVQLLCSVTSTAVSSFSFPGGREPNSETSDRKIRLALPRTKSVCETSQT